MEYTIGIYILNMIFVDSPLYRVQSIYQFINQKFDQVDAFYAFENNILDVDILSFRRKMLFHFLSRNDLFIKTIDVFIGALVNNLPENEYVKATQSYKPPIH